MTSGPFTRLVLERSFSTSETGTLQVRTGFDFHPCNLCPQKNEHRKSRGVFPHAFGAFSREIDRTYFTMILPLGSSVPCTRTRLPSNLATSVW